MPGGKGTRRGYTTIGGFSHHHFRSFLRRQIQKADPSELSPLKPDSLKLAPEFQLEVIPSTTDEVDETKVEKNWSRTGCIAGVAASVLI